MIIFHYKNVRIQNMLRADEPKVSWDDNCLQEVSLEKLPQ